MRILLSIICFFAFAAAGIAEEAKTTYRLLILGDIHYTAQRYHPIPYPRKKRSIGNAVTMWKHKSPELLSAARNQLAAEPADAVIQLGDLTNGDCENRQLHEQMIREAFRQLKTYFPRLPLYTVIGNRDIRQRHENSMEPVRKILLPLQTRELGGTPIGDGHYTFSKGPDLFVVINCYAKEEKPAAFLRKALADHPETRYVFLVTHAPLFPAADRSPLTLIPDYREIAAMLETRKAVVLAGHTHQFSRITRTTKQGRITQMVFTSMGEDWHNNRLVRRFFGNPLQVVFNWDQYLKITGDELAGNKKRQKMLKELTEIASAGRYDGQIFTRKSGFAILNVSDRQVEVRIFLDDSGKPAEILRLY